MRLVHLSDLHLGYRQYQRLTPAGINQREADIASTFQRAVDKIIELRPDVVAVAGDVFHSVRPTNPAIVHAFQQFLRLRTALPDTVVAMAAGNHDVPRTAETGGILGLFREIGVHVADRSERRWSFDALDLSILAVPHVPGPPPKLAPDPAFRHNLLVMHRGLEGILPPHPCDEPRDTEITLDDLQPHAWSYIALGHYHVFRQVAPRTFYSGAIEYASTNVWGELAEERANGVDGKGLVEFDFGSVAHTFHPVQLGRPLLDLPPVRARGMTSPELDIAIRESVESVADGIDGKIVRLVLFDVPRHVARGLDHRALREYRRRAVNFHLDVRRPELIRSQISGAPGRRASLSDLVRDSLRSRHLESDIDREELVNLGLRYLRDAEAAESPVLLEQESE